MHPYVACLAFISVRHPAAAGATGKDMLRSKFCLCPTGYGWGIRFTQAMHTGCVPVIVQVRVRNGRQGVRTALLAQHISSMACRRHAPCSAGSVFAAPPAHYLCPR